MDTQAMLSDPDATHDGSDAARRRVPPVLYDGLGETFQLTGEEAKALFFEQWDSLRTLCRRRFPNDDALADESLDFVVEKLAGDDWGRVRTWCGEGRFSTYLLKIASRLLTDFARSHHGHIRMPAWLKVQQDPIWALAYRLVVTQGYGRRDAINWLCINGAGRSVAFIERVVGSIQLRCRRHGVERCRPIPLDDIPEPAVTDSTPESLLRVSNDEILDALRRYIVPTEDTGAPTARVDVLTRRLVSNLNLSGEDRIILRLRHYEGMEMSRIARILRLRVDPYRRYQRAIGRMRDGLRRAGLCDVGGECPNGLRRASGHGRYTTWSDP